MTYLLLGSLIEARHECYSTSTMGRFLTCTCGAGRLDIPIIASRGGGGGGEIVGSGCGIKDFLTMTLVQW